jgi:hypothetical protein
MAFPSAEDLVAEARKSKYKDLNELHYKTWVLMIRHREKYYEEKVDAFLSTTNLNAQQKADLKKKMLTPMSIGDTTYSNFMEEASRRISQTFQVVSGNIAELCVETALNELGLKKGIHYLRKNKRTDFTFFYPDLKTNKKAHRLEVKNVKLRERGARGLAFDGDSMLGFFDDPAEFTEDNIRVIDKHCAKTGGYCYMPPDTLNTLKHPAKRFKSNLKLAKDMKHFVEKGVMP